MSLDVRRLVARPFAGFGDLGGSQSQSLLAQDQTLKRQIASALAGNPVPGNPFPNASPQQLALALAGSTPWKPWNQSGTIDKAIANTVARFATEGGSDQILRNLQIAAGVGVTVGSNSPGVNVTKDPATTAAMKSGILALLQQSSPSPAAGPPPQPVINVQTSSGSVPVAAIPVSVVAQPSPAVGAPPAAVYNAPAPTSLPPSVPLSSILGMTPSIDPTTGLPYAASSSPPALTQAPLSTGVALPASQSWSDMANAPINLPLVGPVPTWGVVLGAAAFGYALWKRSKRRGAPSA